MRRPAPAAAVALVAVAVRIPGVHAHALWQDEVASARILLEPTIGSALARVERTESTPPLWYVLAWLAHRAGLGIVDVRLLSVAAIGVVAACACVLAERLAGTAAGVTAGLLVAFGGQFAVYGESLRAYALFAALATVLALVLTAAVERRSRASYVALASTVAAGLLTHYFFALSLVAAVGWLWLEPSARAARARVTAAIAGGVALALPWAPEAIRQYGYGRTWWIGPFRLRNVLAAPLRLYTFTLNGTTEGRLLGLAAFAVVVAAAVALVRDARGRLAVALLFVPLVLSAALWAGGLRVFALRNLIEIAPFAAVVVAAAAAKARLTPLAAAAAAALGLALVFFDAHRVPPYDRMAHALVAAGWRPSIPIAVTGDPLRLRGPIEWYLPGRPVLVLGKPRGTCRVVLLVTRHAGVVRTHDVPAGATLLADSARIPACVRRIGVEHAALV